MNAYDLIKLGSFEVCCDTGLDVISSEPPAVMALPVLPLLP